MTARITSAVTLEKTAREQIESLVQKKYGKETVFEYAVDAEVLGGFSITIGSKRFDFSLRGKMSQVRQALL